MKEGETINYLGMACKLIKINKVRKVHYGDRNGNPIGDPVDYQDAYVEFTNPRTGKQNRTWITISNQ